MAGDSISPAAKCPEWGAFRDRGPLGWHSSLPECQGAESIADHCQSSVRRGWISLDFSRPFSRGRFDVGQTTPDPIVRIGRPAVQRPSLSDMSLASDDKLGRRQLS